MFFIPSIFCTFYSIEAIVSMFLTLLMITDVFEQQISILEWFLKDRVTLKTGVNMLQILLYILKYI